MRHVECNAPFHLPNEVYTWGSRTPADAAADHGSSSWDTGSSSDAWSRQDTSSQPVHGLEGGRRQERYRHGYLGGRQRYGDRGGVRSEYYKGFYAAKGKGKLSAFIAKNGPPPSKGGASFHNRKEDA